MLDRQWPRPYIRSMESVEQRIYKTLLDDPQAHRRTDLGPYYRMGYAGISRKGRGLNTKQAAAYRAGAARAKRDGQKG